MGKMGLDGNYFICHLKPMQIQTDPILPRIEAFLNRHALGETVFGKGAAKDTHLVYDLRKGRKLRRATRRAIEEYMRTYRNG